MQPVLLKAFVDRFDKLKAATYPSLQSYVNSLVHHSLEDVEELDDLPL